MLDWVSLFGLFFEIIGVVMLFYYADRVGRNPSLIVMGNREDMHGQVEEFFRKLKIAKWGLGIVIVGSLFQIIGALVA